MNIDAVFRQAIAEVLSDLLATEKVQELADAIMTRAKPELEQSIAQFTGLEFGKSTAPKAKLKPAQAGDGESKRSRKKATTEAPNHHLAMEMDISNPALS